MTPEFVRLAASLVELLKAQELEKAVALACSARQLARAQDLQGRQMGVHEATLGLVEARRMREQLLRQADMQPQPNRAYAREQLERICRELFDPQIAALQTRKRALSRARRGDLQPGS